MKITDTLGRQLHIDPVVQGPKGWMQPVGYNIEDVCTRFVRMPHGPFALRVMSKDGAEIRVHLNGEQLLEANVPGGVQYIQVDKDEKPFMFTALAEGVEDVCTAIDESFAPASADEEGATAQFRAPKGHGLLFVVARFARETGPAPHPPRQEFIFVFQMNTPEDHDNVTAGNLRRMVQPELPPNLDDLTIREAPATSRVLRRTCATCGHQH